MDKELIHLQMVMFLRESMLMENRMEKESIFGQQDKYTLETFKKERSMVLENGGVQEMFHAILMKEIIN